MKAQLHEIGAIVGGSNYIGDIGSSYFVNPNEIMAGIIYKRNLNSRVSLRGTFSMTKLRGSDAKSNEPFRKNRNLSFSTPLQELGLGLEYNYFDYNIYDFRQQYSPYIIFEVAGYSYSVTDENDKSEYKYGITLPIGVGFKSKLTRNMAIGIEVKARYTFTDTLEGIKNITGNRNYNNDWYMISGLTITYSFGRSSCYSTSSF